MPETDTPSVDIQEYTCERCGYVYKKQHDYEPFLCHRCLRYVGKKVFTIMKQVVPPVSRADTQEI